MVCFGGRTSRVSPNESFRFEGNVAAVIFCYSVSFSSEGRALECRCCGEKVMGSRVVG